MCEGARWVAYTPSKPVLTTIQRLFFNDTTGDCILHAIGTMAAIGAGTGMERVPWILQFC